MFRITTILSSSSNALIVSCLLKNNHRSGLKFTINANVGCKCALISTRSDRKFDAEIVLGVSLPTLRKLIALLMF